MSRSILSITLPFLFVGTLQLAGCTSEKIEPPDPGGVYLSTSGGANFEQSVRVVDEQGELKGHIDDLSVSSIHRPHHMSSTIYLVSGNNVFVSDNDGESWQFIQVPLTRVTAFVHLSNDVWLVSGTNEQKEGIVMRSLDKGKSWGKVLTIPSAPEKESSFFEIIKPPDPPAVYVSSLVADPFNEERLYATTSTGDVLIGEDSGKVWSVFARIKATKSDPLTGRTSSPVRRVIPSPHERGEMLLIATDGRLIRVDEEESKQIELPKGSVVDVAYIQQFPEALFVSLNSGVFVSRDRGETWQKLNVPISDVQPYQNLVVRVSPTNPDRILVAVNNVVYRSEDGGNTWNSLSMELPGHVITDISINPENGARVILTTARVKS